MLHISGLLSHYLIITLFLCSMYTITVDLFCWGRYWMRGLTLPPRNQNDDAVYHYPINTTKNEYEFIIHDITWCSTIWQDCNEKLRISTNFNITLILTIYNILSYTFILYFYTTSILYYILQLLYTHTVKFPLIPGPSLKMAILWPNMSGTHGTIGLQKIKIMKLPGKMDWIQVYLNMQLNCFIKAFTIPEYWCCLVWWHTTR
jgi:hypothetical protein